MSKRGGWSKEFESGDRSGSGGYLSRFSDRSSSYQSVHRILYIDYKLKPLEAELSD